MVDVTGAGPAAAERARAQVEALARRLARAAEDVRAARRGIAAAGAVEWQGPSAVRFRGGLTALERSVAALADGCEEAASRLRAHAHALGALPLAPVPA
ncbi:hypothetical protein GTQ99_06360 [Kineococcus sp. T13]|uniref:hypothetical protein n=1 Tax=Kineococcus vitellinus TaxID=2696565 RepID=UPI0014120975|nr:hypothetical protein [Kineococcus vitellinus]NAZ75046.1 hypothetical protein [Kineococcus vitellinus]